MGMYDHVNIEIKCPSCGKLTKGFQSKDRDCFLEILELGEVSECHTHCQHCGVWIEIKEKQKPRRLPEDYVVFINHDDSIKYELKGITNAQAQSEEK